MIETYSEIETTKSNKNKLIKDININDNFIKKNDKSFNNSNKNSI